jgi:hypothetical protein
MRSQDILLSKGLFDPHLVDQAYNHSGSAGYRLRAGIAWGMFNFVVYVCLVPYGQWGRVINNIFSTVELYVRPSTLLLSVPPVPRPCLRVGTDEWSPWPMTRPRLSAHTDEIMVARAKLDLIIRDMLELQQKLGNTRIDESYLRASQSLHRRYKDWMESLEYGLQSCEIASQQHILLQ